MISILLKLINISIFSHFNIHIMYFVNIRSNWRPELFRIASDSIFAEVSLMAHWRMWYSFYFNYFSYITLLNESFYLTRTFCKLSRCIFVEFFTFVSLSIVLNIISHLLSNKSIIKIQFISKGISISAMLIAIIVNEVNQFNTKYRLWS